MGSMRVSMTVIDPYFDGSMAHRSLDEASMEKKSEVDDAATRERSHGHGHGRESHQVNVESR